MKFTTSLGVEVDVRPVALTEKDKFDAIRAVSDAFDKWGTAEDEGSVDWDAFNDMREKLVQLCVAVHVSPDDVGVSDANTIISILQTGAPPEGFTKAGTE